MKKEEQILLYGFNEERAEAAKAICKTLHIKTRVLVAEAYHQKVGYLLGRKAFIEKEAGEPFSFSHEVAILENLQGKRLDKLLLALKALKPPIAYKSVVTPFNVHWTLRRLCENMQKEHGALAEAGYEG